MRILEVDGLRALAMTMVIAQHCSLMPFGWTGVWLFFVISGYVITRGFMADMDSVKGASQRFIDFMRRRFFRIVPVYLAYVLVCVVILLATSARSGLGDLPYLLTFTFNWHMIFSFWPGSSGWAPFGHLWTLSVEEQFYILFPLIALIAPGRLRVPVTIFLICAAPVVRYMYSQSISWVSDDTGWRAFSVYAASVCHFDAFLMGSLVARCEPRLRTTPRYANALWIVALSATGIYVLSYLVINRSLGATGTDALRNIVSGVLYGQNREVFGYVAVNLLACAVLVHALLQRRFSRIFATRALSIVGRISYGGYLFHALVLWLMSPLLLTALRDQPLGARLLIFASAWAITVAVAYISFRWFERPIVQWSQKRTSTRFGTAIPGLQQS